MSGGQRPTPMGQVVAVCGMPGSGKGEFAAVIAEQGVPVLSMGDMVRAEVRRQQLAESPGIFGEIAAQLRAQFGEDVLAVRLADAVDEVRFCPFASISTPLQTSCQPSGTFAMNSTCSDWLETLVMLT